MLLVQNISELYSFFGVMPACATTIFNVYNSSATESRDIMLPAKAIDSIASATQLLDVNCFKCSPTENLIILFN